GKLVTLVPLDKSVNAAACTARGDVEEPPSGSFAEIDGETGDNQDVVLFGDGAGMAVGLRDGGVLVAQVHLDHLLHVLVQLGQSLFNLCRLRPNPALELPLLVVGKVHEPGEALS